MGRPTKYDEETVNRICDAIRVGATRASASACGGISDSLFSQWLKEKPEFKEKVLRAEGGMLARMAARVYQEAVAPDGDWRAALEVLKRRERSEWSERTEQTIGGVGGGPMKVILEYVDIEP
jgi:hypothetical protein